MQLATRSMSSRKPWLRRLLSPFVKGRGFARDEQGTTAIEFGLLALPFFTLIYAILETSIVFFAGQILDSAVQDASRKIRTGEAQTATETVAAWDIDDFRAAVCEGLYGMFECPEVRIKVETLTNFASAAVTNPINPLCTQSADPATECNWTIVQTYDGGVGSDIVLVQAFYKWPTIVNLPGFNLATQAGGTRLLSAIRVFRNEPF